MLNQSVYILSPVIIILLVCAQTVLSSTLSQLHLMHRMLCVLNRLFLWLSVMGPAFEVIWIIWAFLSTTPIWIAVWLSLIHYIFISHTNGFEIVPSLISDGHSLRSSSSLLPAHLTLSVLLAGGLGLPFFLLSAGGQHALSSLLRTLQTTDHLPVVELWPTPQVRLPGFMFLFPYWLAYGSPVQMTLA